MLHSATSAPRALRCLLLFAALCCVPFGAAANTAENGLVWESFPPFPEQISGQFAGTHADVLFVAGGTSFPKPPWDGGPKYWHNKIYALYENAPRVWGYVGKLPQARAYGVSVSDDSGFYIIGGSYGDGHHRDSVRITLKSSGIEQMLFGGLLPEPLAYHGGALISGTIYIVGGQHGPDNVPASNRLYALDIGAASAGWRELEPMPAEGRILPAVAALGGNLHVVSGAALRAGEDGKPLRDYLRDHWVYTPGTGWSEAPPLTRPAVGAVAYSEGLNALVVFGGDDGALAAQGSTLGDGHPGFSREVRAFHPALNAWSVEGEMREALVTSTAVAYDGGIVIPGGENRPGRRSDGVYSASAPHVEHRLNWIDYAAIALYLAALVGVGWYFARVETDTERYFLGGRNIPWWAVGLSIYGTSLSAITYLSIPARAFATDWTMVFANLGVFVVAPLAVWFYIPKYRAAPISTAYEYLETRFHPAIRIYGSLCFLLFQAGRVSIVLLLPSIALNTATGMDVWLCIVIMGALATLYTALGGIEAVIWTDVLQSFVLVFGAILALYLVLTNVDAGIGGLTSAALEADKLRLAKPGWSYASDSLWVIFLGNAFAMFYPTTADQTVVQRYLSTADAKSAGRAALTNMWLTLPTTFLFFALGTALWGYFRENPLLIPPGMKNDAILPLFVMAEFPAGLRGILIAGVFAAAMSSLDSSINSVASVIVNDYYKRYLRPGADDRATLRLARIVTIVMGVVGTACAWLMAEMNAVSLWDPFLHLLGLAGGGLAGLFALGVFTRRGNGQGAIIGALASGAVLALVIYATDTHPMLYGMVGFLTALIAGYAASRALPGKTERASG
jgi:SSS family transporter